MGGNWVDEVLDFWFKDLTNEDWFGGSAEVDEKIRSRFHDLYQDKKTSLQVADVNDARTALAAVIMFDQFPRNMFRKSPAAFGTDDLALGISSRALEKGFDDGLEPSAKSFLYMPFMHSEVLADQERCVDLFRGLGAEDSLKYAIEHRDMIAEFGRFPHRNRALGRQSTPAEVALLETHSGYGQ